MQAYHWEVFVQFYFVAYARWNPYLFGLVAGIVFIKREIALKAQLSDEKAEPKPDSTLSTVLRIVGYILSFTAVLGYSWFRQYRDDIPWRLTAYITLGNTIYGAGLSFIVYHLAIGNLKLLNYILSANWIYPLSMLSYCGYLLHPLFRDALPLLNFSYLGIGFHTYPIVFIFNLIVVIPLALIGYLLVEKPAVNIRPI
jgi:peptidoglycan/LPS O-acetylase OafA/YrhL